MSLQPIANLAIMASAGSGKTHELVSRLMRILALTKPGEEGSNLPSLLAMTFTRVAAGEIFDELVKRVAKAALKPSEDELKQTGLAQSQCAAILRGCVDQMNRAAIGTLDSFFAGVVMSFPLELGLSPDFALLSENEQQAERERLLRKLLAAGRDDVDSRAFIEAFKLYTFGRESRRCHELLDELTRDCHELYLQAPDEAAWGSPESIWGDAGLPFALETKDSLDATRQELLGLLRNVSNERQKARLQEFADAIADLKPGGQLDESSRKSLASFARVLDALDAGSAKPEGFARPALLAELQAPIAVLTRHALACQLQNCLRNTRGIYEILRRYEAEYNSSVRQSGRLVFADLPFLLGDGRLLSASQGRDGRTREDAIRDVEFRLDGRYQHWALDEFQDTSRRQWRAIANLADEVLQRSAEGRSFFMVGDVKQAIFGWRGGDSRLMGEIIESYALPRNDMSVSWRSCPAVLQLVNAVCGSFKSVEGLDPEALARWESLWLEHTPAEPLKKKPGCAFVLESKLGRQELEEKGLDQEAQRAEAVAAELQRIKPWEKGLSAAVLVRGNVEGAALAGFLRESGIEAAWQGSRGIAEQPLVAALLAFCRWLDHPGDTLALWHAKMSPLACFFEKGEAAAFFEGSRLLAESGFATAIELWLARLVAAGRLKREDLSGQELSTLLDAASKFDSSGGRGGLDFSNHVAAFELKTSASSGCVQVMTVHGSKGLGFDVVLLSLAESARGGSGDGLLQCPSGDSDGSLKWVLANPGVLVEIDPVLRAASEKEASNEVFESLCVLYVALTRAKRELVVVLDKPPKEGRSVKLSKLLRDSLAAAATNDSSPCVPSGFQLLGEAPFGDASWFESVRPEKAAVEEARVEFPSVEPLKRRKRKLPSEQELAPDSLARQLFLRHSQTRLGGRAGLGVSGAEFGTSMHELLRDLEWPDSAPQAVSLWRKSLPSSFDSEAANAIERQFWTLERDEELRSLLSKPGSSNCLLWRERNFDVVLGSEWISGAFDRVQIELDGTGRPLSALLVDFKTDGSLAAWAGETFDFAAAARSYEPQMQLYRRALAKLLNLDDASIRAVLLFTANATLKDF